MKRKMIAVFLSVAMLLTFMPAMAFAAEVEAPAKEGVTAEAKFAAAVPVSITYRDDNANGYVGESYFSLYNLGAEITLTYSNGSSKTYIYTETPEDMEEYYDGFFLNGDVTAEELDIDPINTCVDRPLKEGVNSGVGYLEYWYEDESEDGCIESNRIDVTGTVDEQVVSVTYEQKDPWIGSYDLYDHSVYYDEASNIEGDKLTVVTKDYSYDYDEETGEETEIAETTSTYHYTACSFTEEYDDGEPYTYYQFVNDEDPEDYAWPTFADDQHLEAWTPGSEHQVDIYFNGKKAEQTATVIVEDLVLPESVEFIPVEGFESSAYVGMTYVGTEILCGEGNKFVVTYTDGSQKEYLFVANNDYYGFFLDGVGSYDEGKEFYAFCELKEGLKAGVPTVLNFEHYEYIESKDEYARVDFDYEVTASKYRAWADEQSLTYTGKTIKASTLKKKLKVEDSVGNTLKVNTDYTLKLPKTKNVGVYEYMITLKDQDKFIDPIVWATYTVNPKKVTSIKAKSSKKKQLTVSWKKFSKADQKQISGFMVQYSTSSKFKNAKTVKVGKTKASATIKKLKSGKKYYVRVYAYKTVKHPWGGKMVLKSLSATKKAAKVK